jgi:predicted RNA polymerase sigma factor
VSGLLALMLLTDARRPARMSSDGELIPLAEQDRGLWNRDAIGEGAALVARALADTPIGPYQLQAAIAAIHDEAPRAEDTDWREILALYELLAQLAPGPMVTLNRVVALAMVDGPRAGLERLATAATEPALAGHHRVEAVRAHLLEMAGETDAAIDAYGRAARRTMSVPERQFLEGKARALTTARDRSR